MLERAEVKLGGELVVCCSRLDDIEEWLSLLGEWKWRWRIMDGFEHHLVGRLTGLV